MRGYTDEQIMRAANDLAYTTKADYGKIITLADFVEAIEEPHGELHTWHEMLASCTRAGVTVTQGWESVRVEGHDKPMWRKL